MVRRVCSWVVTVAVCCMAGESVRAQTLGSFSWHLAPYCNVITVTVTQNGSNYTLDGYDNQCGGSTRAAVIGMAVPNPTGTVTLGFAIVTPPSGAPVHVTTVIDLGSLGGSWSDDQGNSGTFVFSPSGIGSGSPRPAAINGLADNTVTSAKIVDGAVGALDIDPAQVQQRIQSACPIGQLMTGVNQNGTVVCQAVTSTAGGDITSVSPGLGLTGGGGSGDVTLSVAFGGPGLANAVARSDHTHAGPGANNTAVGEGALRLNLTGQNNLGVGFEALRDATGVANTGLGGRAGQLTTTGNRNTFVGYAAGNTNTTGENNTIIGEAADVGSGVLSNATAIGYRAQVDVSDALVLGGINGVNGASANTYVGIGTTSPDAPLDIDFEPNPSDVDAVRLAATAGPVVVSMQSQNGTRTAPTAVRNNDVLSVLRTNGYTGAGYTFDGRAAIYVQASENWTATATGTNMSFHTTGDGTTGMTERMRITNAGRVAIGRTGAAAPLDVEGDIRLGTGTVGCVQDRDGTVLAGTCSSDARLKREIAPFPSLLDKVSRLRPVTYFWRDAEFPERHFGSSRSFGLIAQEVEAQFPDMVTTDGQGYKAVNYSKLPLVTLQAVRELADENDAQAVELSRLHGELATLRQQIAELARARAPQ